jgi:hypothetical protein
MPFKKVGPNKFVSPSGRKFTRSQVKLYHSLGDRFPGQATKRGKEQTDRKTK